MGSGPVTGVEFDDVFDQRRNQFRPDNLPIDADIVSLTGEPTEHAEKTFVRQLALVGIGNARIRMAVRDFVRAYEQRSRWSSENLLRPGELGDYERRLVEEWERRFNVMVDDLGEDAAESEMRAQAKLIYAWVEQNARFRIRDGCDEAFVTTGSYQRALSPFLVDASSGLGEDALADESAQATSGGVHGGFVGGQV